MCSMEAYSNSSRLLIDMEVDQLIDFMFVKNINNAIIELSLEGIENNKDLLCFFIDTMCKGLVILFGENNRLELDNDRITADDFELIRKKMALAGIAINLSVTENIDNIPAHVNIRELDNYPDNLELGDFTFNVVTINNIYSIKFELIHTLSRKKI